MRIRPEVLLFVAMSSFWALNFPLVKLALRYVSPLQLTYLRFLVAIPALGVMIPRSLRPFRPLRTNLLVALFGALDLFLFTVLWAAGEHYTTPSLAVIIIYTYPLFIIIFGAIILRERLTPPRIIGAILEFLGVTVVSLGYFAVYNPVGLVLILGASLSFSLAAIVYRKYLREEDFVRVNTYHVIYAGLMSIALAGAMGQLYPIHVTPELILLLALIGLPGTAVAYAIYVYLYSRHEVTRIAPYLFVVPALSIFFSYAILRVALTPNEAVGFALLAAGIYISSHH
jgi:drug/metabolite transporter (DMT)-like permease